MTDFMFHLPRSRRRGRHKAPSLVLVACMALPVIGCADASGNARGANTGDITSAELAAAVEGRLDSLSEASLDSIYARPPTPIWVDTTGLSAVGRSAIETLTGAAGEGIPISRYGAAELQALHDDGGLTAATLARLETELTRSLALYAKDLAEGVTASTSFEHGWQLDSLDRSDLGEAAPSGGKAILERLDELRPRVEQYDRLQDVLVRLREIRDGGGWPTVDLADEALEVGDSASAVTQLRARLEQSISDEERRLAAQSRRASAYFDEALGESLSRFQARHDIDQDGVVGPETAAALNAPVDERIAEVELALERWRWLPADLGALAVFVNTPERRVHVLQDGVATLSMKSIIGQREWETALFQDEMEEIVVNPYWNVPESILIAETLPRALADERFLEDNDYEVVDPETEEVVPLDSVEWDDVVVDTVGADSVVLEGFPYRVRQRPGEKNALGAVKFLFPNEYAIYLHDTPADHLFDDRMRTFSHGCVRLERPFDLAHLLLREASSHAPSELDSLLATGEEHVLHVDRVPVYLVYQTVWVDEEGVPTFTPDVYGRNADARRALADAQPPATTSVVPSTRTDARPPAGRDASSRRGYAMTADDRSSTSERP